MSGTTQIASPGKPVSAVREWPAGVLDLLNDPLRTEGWNPWFSQWPNDVNRYVFKLQTTGQVNHLLAKLAAIKADRVLLILSPAREPRALGFTTVLPSGNAAAAVFAIGNQKTIDDWYQRLPEQTPGVRKFGVHTYTEPPKATPPTLTLFAANEAVDLKALRVPPNLEVAVDAAALKRSAAADVDLLNALREFAARHTTTRPNQPGPTPGAHDTKAK